MGEPQPGEWRRGRSLGPLSRTGLLGRPTRPGSLMPHRIALAVEGPSDRAVVETLCRRAGHDARAGMAEGKAHLFQKFDKILRFLEAGFNPTHFLVVTDLHPSVDCPQEANEWRTAIRKRFPRAKLCLSIWELEAWLLADSNAVAQLL